MIANLPKAPPADGSTEFPHLPELMRAELPGGIARRFPSTGVKKKRALGARSKRSVQEGLSMKPGSLWRRPQGGIARVKSGDCWKSATWLVLFSLMLVGCGEPPPATQDELDAIAALQRAHARIETDKLGHASALYFVRVELRDDDLAPIERLSQLKKLNLDGSPVTDSGLAHVTGLKNLKFLSLRGTKITDAGLTSLTALPSLEEIDLEATKITDRGMESLGKISSLKKVYFDRTGPTSAGTDYLSSVNNRLEIHRRR